MADAPAPHPGNNTGRPVEKLSAPAQAMRKLGLLRDIDLALHLPLRYEDETRITALRDVRDGVPAQVHVEVVECSVQFRPRRQLLVRVRDTSDDGEDATLRFLLDLADECQLAQRRDQMFAGAPVNATNWSGLVRNTPFGCPAAAQISSKRNNSRSIRVTTGCRWASGATPPMEKPVRILTTPASAPATTPVSAATRRSSTRRSPEATTSTAESSSWRRKITLLAI